MESSFTFPQFHSTATTEMLIYMIAMALKNKDKKFS
jgi:hypothetical protein